MSDLKVDHPAVEREPDLPCDNPSPHRGHRYVRLPGTWYICPGQVWTPNRDVDGAQREPDPWTSRATLACSATGEHQPHPWTSAVAGSVHCPGLTPEQWATARRDPAAVCREDCCNWRTIPWPDALNPHLVAPVKPGNASPCWACDGSGTTGGLDTDVFECTVCDGTGLSAQHRAAELPDTDIRTALAEDLDRMGLTPEPEQARDIGVDAARELTWGAYGMSAPTGDPEPTPPTPERRTVSVEVLTDELRNPPVDPDIDEALKMIWIPPHARVGIVLRADGQLLAVVETDADWIKRHGPVALLTRLLQQAEHYARDGDAELLMPTPDVLAALDGRPDATFWTAPIPVMHRDMKAGWLLISYADEGESVPAGTERQEPIEAVTDCTPEAVDGVHPAAYATDCRVLTVAGTPCHFDNWLTNLVRIPAAVTR